MCETVGTRDPRASHTQLSFTIAFRHGHGHGNISFISVSVSQPLAGHGHAKKCRFGMFSLKERKERASLGFDLMH